VTDLMLLDVTPHTLGIETKDGTFTPVIERNSNTPTKKSRIFSTVVDNQSYVDVHVLQGESHRAEENTSLGRFQLGRLSPARAREPEIEVTFEIDVNGILQVTARDQGTGRRQDITVSASSGLSASEVQSARTLLEESGPTDEIRKKERASAQLQGLLQSTRKTLELLRAKLTREEQSLAERAIRDAGAAREGSLEEIRAVLSNLETIAEMLGEAMFRG